MKKLLFLVLALFLVPIVSAQLEISDKIVKNTIIPDESASYVIYIKNTGNSPDIFGISVSDVNWREKIENNFLNIGSGETVNTNVELAPNNGLKGGRYSINLRVYSRNNPDNFEDFPVDVDLISYEDLISAVIETNPNGIDPRRENLVRINIKNRYNVEIKNVEIKLSSPLFEEIKTLDISPAELKSEDFNIVLDEDTKKGEYDLSVLVTYNGNVLVDKKEKINVRFYKEINNDESLKEGFLLKTKKVVKENNGNMDTQEVYKERFNSFESLFTSVYPEPNLIYKEEGSVYYQWDIILTPGEVHKIEIITNYRTPLSILLVLVIVLWLAYITFGNRVTIKKKVLTVRSGKELYMKIMVVVKNEGKGKVNSMSILDYLPDGAESPSQYSSVKQYKHQKTSRGIALMWKLSDLVGGEERVISYRVKVKPKTSAVVMPRVIVKYKRGRKFSTSRSSRNTVRT